MVSETVKQNTHIIIPTLNESETIHDVITGFSKQGFPHITVIDGESTDNTNKIVKDSPAELFIQNEFGKGNAIQYILRTQTFNEEYIVFIDGDSTYEPQEIERLLQPLVNENADEVLGNRFANMKSDSMTCFNKFGNYILNSTFIIANFSSCSPKFKDILTGYRAYDYSALQSLSLNESGFGIETELCTRTVQNGYTSKTVPISYYPRPDNSQENLHPIKDGAVILKTLFKQRLRTI